MGQDLILVSYQFRADTIFRKGEMARFNVHVDFISRGTMIVGITQRDPSLNHAHKSSVN